jgi:hypothetical protein
MDPPAMIDIDALVAEINAAGYMVTNCFQLRGGMFQANLRRADGWQADYNGPFNFATGATVGEAMQRAFESAKVEAIVKTAKAKPASPKPPAALPDDLADLI